MRRWHSIVGRALLEWPHTLVLTTARTKDECITKATCCYCKSREGLVVRLKHVAVCSFNYTHLFEKPLEQQSWACSVCLKGKRVKCAANTPLTNWRACASKRAEVARKNDNGLTNAKHHINRTNTSFNKIIPHKEGVNNPLKRIHNSNNQLITSY